MGPETVAATPDPWRARELRREHRRAHARGEREGRPEPARLRLAGYGITAFFAAFAFFLRTLPREVAVELGAVLGGLSSLVLRRRRRTALANLALAFPDRDDAWRARVAWRAFENTGRTAVETIRLPRLTPRLCDELFEWEGREILQRATDDGKGVLALSAHLGFFEGISPAAGFMIRGLRPSLVGRKIKPEAVDRIVRGLRGSCGVDTIASKEAVRDMQRRLRSGEVIGVVLDQNMKSGGGVFVPFFGKLASTTPGLAVLARRSGAAVVPVFITRKGGLGRHRIIVRPPIEWREEDDKREMLVAMTALYTRVIEEFVRARPEEWFWFHQRWRTRPPGEGAPPAADDDEREDDDEGGL